MDDDGGDSRSLSEAVEMLETGVRILPPSRPATLPKIAISVATANVQLDPTRHLDEASHDLTSEEAQRAARYLRDIDRVRYTLAHAMLRRLLSRRLGVTPAEIIFTTGQHGKSRLAERMSHVEFNLSYGNGVVAIAVADRPVGVDVEKIRDNLAFGEIGRRFFRPDELRYLNSGGGSGVRNRFFRLWTRKEAVLKALGLGLSGIEEVSALRSLIVADGAHGRSMCVAVRTLPGPPGHALALAVETR